MTLVQRSLLKHIGGPSSSVVRGCESMLAQSIYGGQRMYIIRRALEAGSAHSMVFQHDTQGLVSHGGYIERQYHCSVTAEDSALEVEALPLVGGKPQAGDTKLVAGWTMIFPNISRACVIAAGSAYRSLGFEQSRKRHTLWVGDLGYFTSNAQLRALFPGAICAHVVKERGVHGFVDFESELHAQRALSAPVRQLNGRSLRVDTAGDRQSSELLAESDRLCWTALAMGLSLGESGITIADLRSALHDEGYGSHEQLEIEFGRWGKLGDAVVELAARLSISKAAPGQLGVACSSCTQTYHLVGLATNREALPGGCPYCRVQRLVSNEALHSVYDSWIRRERSHGDHSVRRNSGPAAPAEMSTHMEGDCVEACLAVVAHRVSLGTACRMFAWLTDLLRGGRDAGCVLSQPPTTVAGELGGVLHSEFGPAVGLSRGTTARATWHWTKCVLVGEAVTNLCVLSFHFRSHPNASKDELHRLQRTEPLASVKSSAVAAAAERGGVMSWLAPAADKYTGADGALLSVQSECWKAAVGALLLSQGGVDDDDSWDVGGGVIHRYLLQAGKLPPLSSRLGVPH